MAGKALAPAMMPHQNPERDSTRLLEDFFKGEVWEGHDFQSCRKHQGINPASSRWGSLWARKWFFQQPARQSQRFAAMARAVRAWLVMVFTVLLFSCSSSRSDHIIIGSKNFTESLILGELIAQQIEAHTRLKVERRFYLAGTYICHQAMLAGRIDIYPEYTGTALTAILKQKPVSDREQVYARVKSEYENRFDLILAPAFGFNDTFAMEIRGDEARRLHIKTLSQAVPYAVQWRAGFGYEFMERPDGYKGLVATYSLHFAGQPRIMDLGLLARALKDRQIDIAGGNSTDGLIPALDLFVLEDDRHYFSPYEAVPVIRRDTLRRHPEVATTLASFAGKISDQEMQQLNYSVDGQRRDVKDVAREFLQKKGLLASPGVVSSSNQ